MGLVQVRGAHKRHEEHPAPLGGATKPRRKGAGSAYPCASVCMAPVTVAA